MGKVRTAQELSDAAEISVKISRLRISRHMTQEELADKIGIDFISGRALRELEPAAKMYSRIVSISNAAVKGEAIPEADALTISEAMDVMVKWFCLNAKPCGILGYGRMVVYWRPLV